MTRRLVYTVPEAAEMLNISTRSCYELVERGQIRCIRLGRNVRIPTSALEELLGQPILEPVEGPPPAPA